MTPHCRTHSGSETLLSTAPSRVGTQRLFSSLRGLSSPSPHSILHFFSADWQPSSAPAALPPTHAALLPRNGELLQSSPLPQLPRDQLDCERSLEICTLLVFHFVLCLKECHNFQQQRKEKRYARLTKAGRKTRNGLFNNQN